MQQRSWRNCSICICGGSLSYNGARVQWLYVLIGTPDRFISQGVWLLEFHYLDQVPAAAEKKRTPSKLGRKEGSDDAFPGHEFRSLARKLRFRRDRSNLYGVHDPACAPMFNAACFLLLLSLLFLYSTNWDSHGSESARAGCLMMITRMTTFIIISPARVLLFFPFGVKPTEFLQWRCLSMRLLYPRSSFTDLDKRKEKKKSFTSALYQTCRFPFFFTFLLPVSVWERENFLFSVTKVLHFVKINQSLCSHGIKLR